ncbi:hypothetical protein SeMB42_g05922 [Synchytrium endobioticum]|nr:hypothetical protein SeMB42_g05922 [Synchytrium endobioticum]
MRPCVRTSHPLTARQADAEEEIEEAISPVGLYLPYAHPPMIFNLETSSTRPYPHGHLGGEQHDDGSTARIKQDMAASLHAGAGDASHTTDGTSMSTTSSASPPHPPYVSNMDGSRGTPGHGMIDAGNTSQSMSKSTTATTTITTNTTPLLTPTAAYNQGVSPSLVNTSVIMMLMMMNSNGNGDPLIDIIRELLSQHREMRMAMSRDDIDEVQNILARVRQTLDHPALASLNFIPPSDLYVGSINSSNGNGSMTAAEKEAHHHHTSHHQHLHHNHHAHNLQYSHQHLHAQQQQQQQQQQGESSILLRSSIAYLTQQIVNVSRPRATVAATTHYHHHHHQQQQMQLQQPLYMQSHHPHHLHHHPAYTNTHTLTHTDGDESSSTSSNWLPVVSPVSNEIHAHHGPTEADVKTIQPPHPHAHAHVSNNVSNGNYNTRRKTIDKRSQPQTTRKLNKSERAFTRAVAKKTSPSNTTNTGSLSPVDDVEDEEEEEECAHYDDSLDHEFDDHGKLESDSTNLSDLPSDDSDEYEPSQSNRRRRLMRAGSRNRGGGGVVANSHNNSCNNINSSNSRKRGGSVSSCSTIGGPGGNGRPVKRRRTDDDVNGNGNGNSSSCGSGDKDRPKRSSPKKGNSVNVDGDGIVRRPNHPEHVSRVLKAWLFAHTDHPYPTDEEKDNLCRQTGLSITQCNNWFINARRRLLPPKSQT